MSLDPLGGLSELANEVSFRVNRALPWAPGSLKRRVADVERIVAAISPEAPARHAELGSRYDLSAWPSVCTASEYRESLYVLDLCDRFVVDGAAPGRCLDVGSKNGAYLPGACTAIPSPWDAVELDAHRRYWNLATRRTHAEGLLRPWPESRYVAGSLLELTGRYAVITWLLPFVVRGPFVAWGLPARFFEPERLLRHAIERLAPGGVLFIVNQGEEEATVQSSLFGAVGADAESLGRIDSVVSPFKKPRFGWRYRRG